MEKWILYKIPQNEFIENLELVLSGNSNSIGNLDIQLETKLLNFLFRTTFVLGAKGEKGFKIVQMNLEKDLRKEFQKKKKKERGGARRPQPHFWPTSRSRPSLPVLAPFPAPARGRPRRAVVARRQSSPAAWRACGSLDAPRSATRSARPRPPPSPLPFVPLRSRSRPLSCSRAAAAAPPRAIVVDARSFSPD